MTDLDYDYDDNQYPLAYFITFRTHGTWLHGDQRKAVDRHGKNIFNTPRIQPDPRFSASMETNMSTEPVLLDGPSRAAVRRAIQEVCSYRAYRLIALTSEPITLMSFLQENSRRTR